MTWTPEQEDFFAALTGSVDNLFLEASAGSGKSTTIAEGAKRLGPGRRILFFAFNKDIVTALRAKLPYFVTATTFHSYCYDVLGQHLGKKPQVDDKKCNWFLKYLVPEWDTRKEIEEDVLKLVSLAKAFGYRCFAQQTSDESWMRELGDSFGLDSERVMGIALTILDKCLEDKSRVDFDDMIWLPLAMGLKFPPAHIVFVDEAQDTNATQRMVIERTLGEWTTKPSNGCRCANCGTQFQSDSGLITHKQICTAQRPRVVAVGDPHQAIYAFRGADANACDALRDAFAMKTMPLSVSWRCSKRVVAEAQKYL